MARTSDLVAAVRGLFLASPDLTAIIPPEAIIDRLVWPPSDRALCPGEIVWSDAGSMDRRRLDVRMAWDCHLPGGALGDAAEVLDAIRVAINRQPAFEAEGWQILGGKVEAAHTFRRERDGTDPAIVVGVVALRFLARELM